MSHDLWLAWQNTRLLWKHSTEAIVNAVFLSPTDPAALYALYVWEVGGKPWRRAGKEGMEWCYFGDCYLTIVKVILRIQIKSRGGTLTR